LHFPTHISIPILTISIPLTRLLFVAVERILRDVFGQE